MDLEADSPDLVGELVGLLCLLHLKKLRNKILLQTICQYFIFHFSYGSMDQLRDFRYLTGLQVSPSPSPSLFMGFSKLKVDSDGPTEGGWTLGNY